MLLSLILTRRLVDRPGQFLRFSRPLPSRRAMPINDDDFNILINKDDEDENEENSNDCNDDDLIKLI